MPTRKGLNIWFIRRQFEMDPNYIAMLFTEKKELILKYKCPHMNSGNHHKEIVKQLKDLLLAGNAHVSLNNAFKDVPEKIRGMVPDKLPYSIWQLAEHIRIAQRDILEFSRNPRHISPKWPEGYWPKENAPKDDAAWKNCIVQIKKDREAFIELLEDIEVDLYKPFPHGEGQNLLREALLIADHNSYHVGEIIAIRRMLGDWK